MPIKSTRTCFKQTHWTKSEFLHKKTMSHWKNTLFLTHKTQLLPPKRLAERLFWEEKVLCWMARGVSGVDVPSLLTDCGSQHEMIWVNRLAAHSQIRHLIKFTPVCLSLAIVGYHVSVQLSTAVTKRGHITWCRLLWTQTFFNAKYMYVMWYGP